MTTDSICDCGQALPTGMRVCHCAGCHSTFAGVQPFDIHRRGTSSARRCIPDSERAASGLGQDIRGVWHRPHGRRP